MSFRLSAAYSSFSASVTSGARFMANHLDVVPVRVDDERRIVVRVIVRAKARRAVVLAARRESRAMEVIDLPAILGDECDVKMRGLLRGLAEDQRDLSV